MKKLLCLCFSVSIIFCSCSIQKRVHRPGYAIEWNSGKRIGHTRKETAPGKTPLSRTAKQQQTENAAEEFIPVGELTVLNPDKAGDPFTKPADVKITRQARQLPLGNVKVTHSKPLLVKHKHAEQYQPLHQTNDDKIVKGLLFVLVALLLFGLGLIFALFLGLFGVVFLLIFSIAAVIFLVFGLLMMIVGLVG